MAIYKYSIELSYLDVETSKITNIGVEHIRTLVIDYDYDEKNMPILMLTLVLDSNLVDDMIAKANKNLINMAVYKVAVGETDESNRIKSLYFRDQFNYFLKGDKNYNKELDYMNEDGTPDIFKKDNFIVLRIGLISKWCLDSNKTMFNKVIRDSNMFNLVKLVLKHMEDREFTIEPFTYNKQLDQFIVPPKETVVKTLKFLNNMSVFYDTKYRFFLDFDGVYLISSSGKAIERKGEKYSSVLFNVYATNEDKGMVRGMTEKNGSYLIPLSVKDTNFAVNTSLSKKATNVIAALDATKQQVQTTTSEIKSAIRAINSFIRNVNTASNNIKDTIRSTINSASSLKNILFYEVERAANISIGLGDVEINMKNILSSKDISMQTQNKLMADIFKAINKYQSKFGEIEGMPELYDKQVKPIVYKTVSNAGVSTSYVNGVATENVKDNTSALQTHCSKSKACNEECKDSINTVLIPTGNSFTIMDQTLDEVILGIETLPDTIEEEGTDPETGQPSIITKDISEIKEYLTTLKEYSLILKEANSSVNGKIINIKDAPALIDGTINTISLLTNNVVDIPDLFTQEYKSDGLPLSATSNSITLKSIKTDFKVTGFDEAWKSSLTQIGNAGNNIIKNIKSDLDSMVDISDIASLKFTTVSTDLSLGTTKFDKAKSKIIRVPNGNVNILKNIKSELELSHTRLMINKNDLDGSVFTINKEYSVKNYDGHSEKNGKYLLARKRELYLREDDLFSMNTLLDFKQIKNNKLSGNSKDNETAKDFNKALDKTITSKTRL